MRWLGSFVGEEQVIRKFAFLPIKANGEWRWLSLYMSIKLGMEVHGTMIGLKIREYYDCKCSN